jgi:RNA polymerase sigma-70 factor, ECF subfamily
LAIAVNEDETLVDACRAGRRDALEEVFRRHVRGIERLIRKLVGPSADLDDLLQNTFIAAIAAFPRYRGEAPLGGWLAGIAVRVVRDHLRRPERRRLLPLDTLATDQEPAAVGAGPERHTDDRRQLARLYAHLDRVDADKRVAFVLHVLDGHPIEEVAALVGASTTATKSRVFWARRKLLARVRKDPLLRHWLDAGDDRGGHA